MSKRQQTCALVVSGSLDKSDTFFHEQYFINSGAKTVAGVDEAGRGPLAGPVVASCVILPTSCDYHRFKDSKKLTSKQRQQLYTHLYSLENARIGVSIISAREIERINILQASLLAMKRAIFNLAENNSDALPSFLLVDGKFEVPMELPQKALVKGESKSASIAAASIIAKVTRDQLMDDYHKRFPLYNFKKNKGYPTKEHRLALSKHGPCEIHRRTFKGVKEFFNSDNNLKQGQANIW